MARPKEYDDDLRLALVEAAARILADEGPGAVTTRRVATEVGTSTTAIYSLIGSKEELFRAVHREGFARLARHLATVEETNDPIGDIGRLGDAYQAMALESPHLYHVMFGAPPPGFEQTPEDAAESLATLEVLIAAVRRAVDADLLVGDPDDLAAQLWAMNHGVISLGLVGLFHPPERAGATLAGARRAMLTGHRPTDAAT